VGAQPQDTSIASRTPNHTNYHVYDNIDMELDVYLFSSIAMILYIAHLLITSPKEHSILILAVLALSIYGVYEWYQRYEERGMSVAKRVDQVVKLTDEYRHVRGDEIVSKKKEADIVKVLIASDPFLMKSIKQLEDFKGVSAEAYTNILDLLLKFYEGYVRVLMSHNPVTDSTVHDIVETRKSLLNTLSTLFLQTSGRDNVIKSIILTFQASTYRCLNIIKNKYDVMQHVAPVPVDMDVTSHFNLY